MFLRRNKNPPLIKPGSVDESIVADWIEAGLVYRYTTIMVNQHRADEGREIIGRNAVMNAVKSMRPKIQKIQKRNQGNKNHKSWVKARYNQCLQFKIMLNSKTILDLPSSEDLPTYFDPNKLPTLTR